eukprot:GSChrysophyteH1.ASY1.ANO1.243.1 assembled CDS
MCRHHHRHCRHCCDTLKHRVKWVAVCALPGFGHFCAPPPPVCLCVFLCVCRRPCASCVCEYWQALPRLQFPLRKSKHGLATAPSMPAAPAALRLFLAELLRWPSPSSLTRTRVPSLAFFGSIFCYLRYAKWLFTL